MNHDLKSTVDGLSLGAAFGSLAGWLPNIAALMAIVWTGIRIYEWWRERRHPPRRRFND